MSSDSSQSSISTTSSQRQANPAIVSAAAGLLAATVGKAIMHPIDTIKAKLQVISMPKGVHGGSGDIQSPTFLKG